MTFYLEPLGLSGQVCCAYVTAPAGREIEEEFLKKVIKSPRECHSIVINPENLKYRILCAIRAKGN